MSGLSFSLTTERALSAKYCVGTARRPSRASSSFSRYSRSSSYSILVKRLGGLICDPRPAASGLLASLMLASLQLVSGPDESGHYERLRLFVVIAFMRSVGRLTPPNPSPRKPTMPRTTGRRGFARVTMLTFYTLYPEQQTPLCNGSPLGRTAMNEMNSGVSWAWYFARLHALQA